MASAFDSLFADTSVAALRAVHGVSVTRWPGGNQGASVAVADYLWTPDEMPDRHADMDGERYVVSGTLQVPTTTTPTETDQWVIDDVKFQTISIGDPHGGLRTLTLRRTDKVTTSRHRGDFR